MSIELYLKLIFWFFLVAGTIFEISADFVFKKWSIEGGSLLIVFGLILYMVGTFFWISTLKYELLSKSASIFLVLNLIGVVLVGVLIFKENLTLINKIGIILGILSIILIEN